MFHPQINILFLKSTCCLLLFFWSAFIFAQPCNFPFAAANTCETAPLVCTLDGYCSSNTGSTNTGTPNAFCGIVENNSWVKFIAGSTFLNLQITVNNCQNNSGLQAQFFSTSDCNDFTAVSNCLDPVFGTDNLNCDNLIVGEVYYLMMDGKNGDVCDYQYVLLSGSILSPASVSINTADTICPNGTLELMAMANSPNANLTYNWTTTDGSFVAQVDNAVVEISSPGLYEVAVADDQGCTAETTVTVVEAPEFSIDISLPDTLNCVDNLTEILTAGASPTNGQNYTYIWTTTDGNILAGANTNAPEVDRRGIYYLEVMNRYGCVHEDSVQVFADVATPVADAGPDGELNCVVSKLELGASLSSLGNDFSYMWTSSNGNFVGANNTLNVLVDAAGTYQLQVTNNVNACTAIDEVVVLLNEEIPSSANILVQQPCFGTTEGSINIQSVTGGTPPYEYFIDGINLGNANEKDFLPAADYEIVVRDATGCEWDTMIQIATLPKLLLDLGDDQFVVLGCETDLQAITNLPINQIDTLVWNPPLDCAAPCLDTSILPLRQTTYTLHLRDVNGCEVRDTVTFFVRKERHVYVPNAFSPNGDGINDSFVVYGGKDVLEIKTFRVFDRWGELVFENKNFLPNQETLGWNGEIDNRRMNQSLFVYFVEVLFLDGWVETFKGEVNLQR